MSQIKNGSLERQAIINGYVAISDFITKRAINQSIAAGKTHEETYELISGVGKDLVKTGAMTPAEATAYVNRAMRMYEQLTALEGMRS